MKAFVTGATGFIGSHLVDALRARGVDVVCLVRSSDGAADLRASAVESVFGNLRIAYGTLSDTNVMRKALVGVDLVVHAAGILGGFRVDDKEYYHTHVEGTMNVVNAAAESRVGRFIHISTAGVVGPSPNTLTDETTPYNPSNVYEETKMLSERIVAERAGEIGATILRPAFVYGPRDKHVLGLFRLVKNGTVPVIDHGRSLLHPTYVGDVVEAMNLALDKNESVGQTYVIAGEKPLPVADFIDHIGKALDVKPKKVFVPLPIATPASALVEAIGTAFGVDPPLTKSRVLFFTQSRAYNTQKARTELGFKPTPLAAGLKETVVWYKKNAFL